MSHFTSKRFQRTNVFYAGTPDTVKSSFFLLFNFKWSTTRDESIRMERKKGEQSRGREVVTGSYAGGCAFFALHIPGPKTRPHENHQYKTVFTKRGTAIYLSILTRELSFHTEFRHISRSFCVTACEAIVRVPTCLVFQEKSDRSPSPYSIHLSSKSHAEFLPRNLFSTFIVEMKLCSLVLGK